MTKLEQLYIIRQSCEDAIVSFSKRNCGNCMHWMTRECPREYNGHERIYVAGKKVIVSMDQHACSDFIVKQHYIDSHLEHIEDIDSQIVELKLISE